MGSFLLSMEVWRTGSSPRHLPGVPCKPSTTGICLVQSPRSPPSPHLWLLTSLCQTASTSAVVTAWPSMTPQSLQSLETFLLLISVPPLLLLRRQQIDGMFSLRLRPWPTVGRDDGEDCEQVGRALNSRHQERFPSSLLLSPIFSSCPTAAAKQESSLQGTVDTTVKPARPSTE